MDGKCREEFIFAFSSQKPFTKIKTAKFLLPTCTASEWHFNLALPQLSSRPNCNRSLSASVPLMVIVQGSKSDR